MPGQNYIYIGKDAGFWKRVAAIAKANTSPSTTTFIIEDDKPPEPTMAFDEMPEEFLRKPPQGPRSASEPIFAFNLRKSVSPRTPVDPTFKMIFWTVVGLTVFSFVVWIGASLLVAQTAAAHELTEGCETITKLGVGAIFGLLGGKATRTHA
jgi:hypothetical protein